jgi:hypothetical protein
MILREQVRAAVGFDPLARPGMLRWSEVVSEVYGGTVYRADPRG